MNITWIENGRGYPIPICRRVGQQERILIICHGFGSSQRSPIVEMLRQRMPELGIGTVSFDFPAHGSSPVEGNCLRVENCLEDLACVERYVNETYPGRSLGYFASSFGAYIALLYLARYPHRGSKAFLRSAAVDMYGIVTAWGETAPPNWIKSSSGDPMEDYFSPDYNYCRPIKFTRGLLEDLRQNDVFALYPQKELTLRMIHGEADSTAPFSDARRFAALSGARMTVLPGAEHRLMGKGELEQVMQAAEEFFSD